MLNMSAYLKVLFKVKLDDENEKTLKSLTLRTLKFSKKAKTTSLQRKKSESKIF